MIGGGHGAGVAEGAFAGLGGGVVVAVHGDGIRNVGDFEALLDAPAGVFVVFGELEVLAEAAALPDIAADAAADHAEEVVPRGGFAVRAEAAVVVVREDGETVRAGDLAGEGGGGAWVLEGVEERLEPERALRGGVGVEEDDGIGGGEAHAGVHDLAGVVFVGLDLDEVGWVSGLDEILGAVGGAAVDDDEFP